MPEFRSWRSYTDFESATKQQRRYIRDPTGEQFLDAVLATAENRTERIPTDSFLWRAQLGHSKRPIILDGEYVADAPAPYPPDRMKPIKDCAREGRANPKGLSYLYVATNRETALAEVRPWIGSLISVAQFRTRRMLRVVNCTIHQKGQRIYVGEEPSLEEREESVWVEIDRAFARPVTPSDDLADYAPTQVIAELFKVHGLDGVAYESSLGPGHNIVLFDLNAADPVSCFLFEVETIKFAFEEAANSYPVKAQTERLGQG